METDISKQPERKSVDDRNKMTDLERLRHSCAHVMAPAILRLWPDAQFASGPAVENGFYYDLDLQHRITPEDFPAIEAEMKQEIKANHTFEKVVVTREQAIKDSESGRLGGLSERPGNPSKFKLGNLEGIPEGEAISYYKTGDFIDLCAGPHVMRTGNIGVAGGQVAAFRRPAIQPPDVGCRLQHLGTIQQFQQECLVAGAALDHDDTFT